MLERRTLVRAGALSRLAAALGRPARAQTAPTVTIAI